MRAFGCICAFAQTPWPAACGEPVQCECSLACEEKRIGTVQMRSIVAIHERTEHTWASDVGDTVDQRRLETFQQVKHSRQRADAVVTGLSA